MSNTAPIRRLCFFSIVLTAIRLSDIRNAQAPAARKYLLLPGTITAALTAIDTIDLKTAA